MLLDQRVMAGMGNVYKSEVLFVCGVNPFVLAGSLERGDRASTRADGARKFLQMNVSASLAAMTTVHGLPPNDAASRPARAPLGLRPRAPAVPPLWHDDQRPRAGARTRLHLLASHVPAVERRGEILFLARLSLFGDS